LKILLQFVSSYPEMIGGTEKIYSVAYKTTQPGIQACPMRAQYREPATRAPDTRHPGQDWFSPAINS